MSNNNLLVVFDEKFEALKLLKYVKQQHIKKICLFSLADDYLFIDQLVILLQEHGLIIEIINTAEVIDSAVTKLSQKILKWSYEIGEHQVDHKTVKQWLLLPHTQLSSWWLSLLSEKNPIKTNVFLRIAQITALEEYIIKNSINTCYLVTIDYLLSKSVKKLTQTYQLKFIKAKSLLSNLNLIASIRVILQRIGLLGSMLIGLKNIFNITKQSLQAKKLLTDFKQRITDQNQLAFISYFPSIDKEAAKKGIFKNKYALALQELFKENSMPVTWVLMLVMDGKHSYAEIINIAKKFSEQGEKLFVLQEFLTFKTWLQCLWLWLRQVLISTYLLYKLPKSVFTVELTSESIYPLVKSLWQMSFTGAIGVQGIFYHALFGEMFKQLKGIDTCLYYAEMQAWEKALNAAKINVSPAIKTIGFQHTAFSPNYFQLYYYSDELKRTKEITRLPLPDYLAANGEVSYNRFKKCGYKNLIKLEAVRQLYINDYMQIPLPKEKDIDLLIVGSMDKYEMLALIKFVIAAYPTAKHLKIGFKSHPFLLFSSLGNVLGVDLEQLSYQCFDDADIPMLLARSVYVLAGSTTVGVEALVFNCQVIVPVFTGAVFMSPLYGFEEYYKRVYTPTELQNLVSETNISDMETFKKKQAFVTFYWNLNWALPEWKALLINNLLMGQLHES